MLFAVLSGFFASMIVPFMRFGRRRITGWFLALLPLFLTLFFAFKIPAILSGLTLRSDHAWFSSLGISLSFHLDAWSLVFALLITGIGTFITLYAWDYLGDHSEKKSFFCYLFMFMASMLGIVLSSNAILLFVFWELTSLSSYFLIGFDHEHEKSRSSALQALLVTGLGGLAMLAGFLMLGKIVGSFEITTWILQGDAIRDHALFVPALSLILLGAFTKSAQFPFHFWLPSAMVAPTPVSAYLHSSTMVKAGVYLLARLFPIFGGTPVWGTVLPWVGGMTVLVGAYQALRAHDMKLHLAYITVSALGMMVLLIGVGSSLAIHATILFLIAHALYKGSLFMVAGSVHHATGLRDPGKLAGLWAKMPITAFSSVIAGASLASIPLFLGFTAKERVLESVLIAPGSWVLASGISLSGMVFATMFLWVALRPFIGKAKVSEGQEVSFFMWSGALMLALLGMVTAFFPSGYFASFWEKAIFAISRTPLYPESSAHHGSGHALLWSLASWAGGLVLYWTFRRARSFLDRSENLFRLGPEKMYQNSLKVLAWLAKTQTHFLQSGSLRYYFRVVIATVIVLTGWALFRAGWPEIRISPFYFFETVLAVLIVAGTLATLFSKEKLAAIAYLGVVGLSISLIFFLFGAPDLALTQFAVEVLTLILLALVLYRLPHFKSMSSNRTVGIDAVLSILAGLTMFAFVFLATSQRGGVLSAVARFYTENSWKLAHGWNVVNVILVDFRGFDTLGEITVLAIAGIGAFSLLKLIVGHKREL